MPSFLWVGSTGSWDSSLTGASANHFGDKYNFSASGNWKILQGNTWFSTSKTPTLANVAADGTVYIGSNNDGYGLGYAKTRAGWTAPKSPCLFGGWKTLAEAGASGACAALLRYSGEFGYWGETGADFDFNSSPMVKSNGWGTNTNGKGLPFKISADNYLFPYLGGGITGDILKWCRYNDGVSADYQYTSCTTRQPHEPLKLMVQRSLAIEGMSDIYRGTPPVGVRGATAYLNTYDYVIPNTLDEDGTPELHTYRTKRKIDLVLRTSGGLSGGAAFFYPLFAGNQMSETFSRAILTLDGVCPDGVEVVLDGGRFTSLNFGLGGGGFIAEPINWFPPYCHHIPGFHTKLGSIEIKNMEIADVGSGSPNYSDPKYDTHQIAGFILSPVTFRNCSIARANFIFSCHVPLEARRDLEGYYDVSLYAAKYILPVPILNFYGCTFDVSVRNRSWAHLIPGTYPSYTGVSYATPTSFGNTMYWGNLRFGIYGDTDTAFAEFDAPECPTKRSTIAGDISGITFPSVYIHATGITYPEFVMSADDSRNQFFSVNIGEEGSTHSTKINHLSVSQHSPDAFYGTTPQYVPAAQWLPLDYFPTRVFINSSLNANYGIIGDFGEIVAGPNLYADERSGSGISADIRIGEVRLHNFGTLNLGYNPDFTNWRIGGISGGSSAAAGNVLGGIRFFDETGIIKHSQNMRLWNTQTYNGSNARQGSAGKIPPADPELGLP